MKKYFLFFILLIPTISFSQSKIKNLQERLQETKSEQTRLKILDTLTKAMVRANHPKQWKYLNEIIDLAKAQNNYDLAASKTRFIAQKHIYGRQSDSAIYVVEEMLKEKANFTTKKSEAHLLLKRAAAYFNKEMLTKASKDYDTSAALFLATGDSIYAADARFYGGQVYTNLKEFLTAINRLEEAYKLYDILGDSKYANFVIGDLANLYGKNKFYTKAILERQKALEGFLKIKNYEGISTTHIQLGGDYFSNKKYEVGKKHIDSAQQYTDSITRKVIKARLRTYIEIANADYYLHKNNTAKAKEHIVKAEEQQALTDAPEYYNTNLLLQKAKYYKKTGQKSLESNALKDVLLKKGKISDVGFYLKAEKNIAELYAKEKKYEDAYKHIADYIKTKESVENEIRTNTFLYYQSQFETERKDNEIYKKKSEIQLLEKDKEIAKNKRLFLWALILAILLLSVIISYYIWKQGKQKRKTLAIKVEKSKKELEEYTKLLIEKSKTQEILAKEIENLKEKIGAQESTEKLQDLTAIKILTNEDWYTFKEKFKTVYPNFFASIKNRGFDLTKSEERLIAMEKLYLDTNEIASMLAISQDSVTRSRSRLRKKINAPKGHSILEYLEVS